VVLDPHQAQEHLLSQVGSVGDIAQTLREIATQAITVFQGDRRDEAVFHLFNQR
jgi:hypothetical protein